ncbi:hypothetical protein P7K49_034013 [Saguinus oedipus]|uniref:Uncharacterized protein n=1 Tax=Saguinus oedipus TaxID=9490 RepID=A0ABQ9TTJ8_SAGOE|nr:hypothetical protein P7K49_034013 [Saguinus oedipus]
MHRPMHQPEVTRHKRLCHVDASGKCGGTALQLSLPTCTWRTYVLGSHQGRGGRENDEETSQAGSAAHLVAPADGGAPGSVFFFFVFYGLVEFFFDETPPSPPKPNPYF